MEHRRAPRCMRTPRPNPAKMRRNVLSDIDAEGSRRGFGRPHAGRGRQHPMGMHGAAPLVAGLALAGSAACAGEESAGERKLKALNADKAIITGPDGSKTVSEVKAPERSAAGDAKTHAVLACAGIEAALIAATIIVAVKTKLKLSKKPPTELPSAF